MPEALVVSLSETKQGAIHRRAAGTLAEKAVHADATTAALWGVFLHGEAGNVLATRQGRIGFLARELSGELPALMESAVAR